MPDKIAAFQQPVGGPGAGREGSEGRAQENLWELVRNYARREGERGGKARRRKGGPGRDRSREGLNTQQLHSCCLVVLATTNRETCPGPRRCEADSLTGRDRWPVRTFLNDG